MGRRPVRPDDIDVALLGLAGAHRTRTDNEHVVELLVSLALLSRAAFVAPNERAQRGLIAANPPRALLAELSPALAA